MKNKKFKKKSGFEYLLGKAVDRKGMGMELALLVLLVVFACSTLLVSSALMGKSSIKEKEAELKLELELDAIAEAGSLSTEQEEKYELDTTPNGFVVKDKDSGKTLTVETEADGTITRWRYN